MNPLLDLNNMMFGRIEPRATQKQTILAHLEKYGQITSLEAMNKYLILRLQARIGELRKHHNIKTIMVDNARRGKHAVYKLQT